MALYAFKNGEPESRYNEDRMNSLLSMQDFTLIYEGEERDARTGSGAVENNLANHNYCTRFILTGSDEIGRVEIEIDRDGTGSDLIMQIRSDMDPASGDDGTLLQQIVVPKEFIPDPKAYWSVPIGLTDLTPDGQYWLVILQGGDAVNHLDWIGEVSQDANYPAYRRNGDSGNWTASEALHFRICSGAGGDLFHGLYGPGHTTLIYQGDELTRIYRYLPPADGPDGGIRDVMTLIWDGDLLTKGEVE